MTILLTALAMVAPGCHTPACHHRVHVRHMRQTVRPYRSWIRRTAQCESGGRWHIATGNGFYGGMQFTIQSWRGVGGKGYPHHASKLEQSYRSVLLRRQQGVGAWPVCGR